MSLSRRRKSNGEQMKHRKQRSPSKAATVGISAVTVASIMVGGAATAMAAPTNPTPGGGVTNPTPGGGGNVTNPTPAEKPREYWVDPGEGYNNVPTRSYESTQPGYTPPTNYNNNGGGGNYNNGGNAGGGNNGGGQNVIYNPPVQEAPQPDPEDRSKPVAPIEAPEGRLRLGDYITDKPTWMTQEDMEKTNNTAAAFEARMATFWRDQVGFDVARSDRTAAATLAGAAAGAAIVGVPAAVVGAVPGALIGAGIGAYSWGALGLVTTVVGVFPGAVVGGVGGAAAGAGIGALLVGVPGALIGGAIGAGIGAATGAGDTLDNPIELFPGQNAPQNEAPGGAPVDNGIVHGTENAIQQIDSVVPGSGKWLSDAHTNAHVAVEQAQPVVEAAVQDFRNNANSTPAGAEALKVADAAGENFAQATAPVRDQLNAIGQSIHEGLIAQGA